MGSTIASHRDLRRCHDGGTARPRSPRARPTSSLRERPGRVRSCSSSPLDLTSGGPARGLHAPPGPNGLLQGRHVPPALLPPHRSSYYPACRFLFSPALIRSSQSTRDIIRLGPAPPYFFAPKKAVSCFWPVETAPFFFFAAGASSGVAGLAAEDRFRGAGGSAGSGTRGSKKTTGANGASAA